MLAPDLAALCGCPTPSSCTARQQVGPITLRHIRWTCALTQQRGVVHPAQADGCVCVCHGHLVDPHVGGIGEGDSVVAAVRGVLVVRLGAAQAGLFWRPSWRNTAGAVQAELATVVPELVLQPASSSQLQGQPANHNQARRLTFQTPQSAAPRPRPVGGGGMAGRRYGLQAAWWAEQASAGMGRRCAAQARLRMQVC